MPDQKHADCDGEASWCKSNGAMPLLFFVFTVSRKKAVNKLAKGNGRIIFRINVQVHFPDKLKFIV
ncbi:hypothetical protein [Parageobacillus thermantarcticus]|uniref:hypothetical protein n=1 Tax=Parageobacillus thermantarcticus TaxID=186116 RepID=UPI001ABEF6FC|nr:hypothetical protein [Parageobacillus thermantarcticus]